MGHFSDTGSTFVHHFPKNDRETGAIIPAAYRTECCDYKFHTLMTPTGAMTYPVFCGKCKHCNWSKRQSFASSCLAEMQTSDWCYFLTLTIRPGAKVVLNKEGQIVPWDDRDETCEVVDLSKKFVPAVMQAFQKTLRNRRVRMLLPPLESGRPRRPRVPGSFDGRQCTSLRYAQVGEFGSKRGRAHYHALLFGIGEKPLFAEFARRYVRGHDVSEMASSAYRNPSKDRSSALFLMPEWPYGFCHVMEAKTIDAAWYLGKYLRKTDKSWSSRSSRVAIGGEHIKRLGRHFGETGAPVPTQNWRFSLGVRRVDRNGRPQPYHALLLGAKRRYLVDEWLAATTGGYLSRARIMPDHVRPAMVAFEIRKRRRAFKDIHGRMPGKMSDDVPSGEDDAIKEAVWNDFQRVMGLPETDLQGRPRRAAIRGTRRNTQAGRDFIKSIPFDAEMFGPDKEVLGGGGGEVTWSPPAELRAAIVGSPRWKRAEFEKQSVLDDLELAERVRREANLKHAIRGPPVPRGVVVRRQWGEMAAARQAHANGVAARFIGPRLPNALPVAGALPAS